MHFHSGVEEYDIRMIPNGLIDNIVEKMDGKRIYTTQMFIHDIDSNAISVMRCPQCGRLWIDENKMGVYFPYVKEAQPKLP